MIAPLLAAFCLIGAPIDVQNGDFRQQIDGKPAGWALTGQARLISDGGRNGMPAVELQNNGTQESSARQDVRLDPPRKGAFAVTAWIRCDQVQEIGGDCSLWLDVQQKDGPALWGQQGFPIRTRRGWQQVRAEVRPTLPVSLVSVFLMLRNVSGKVRFCDVRVEDMPFDISDFRALSELNLSYRVAAAFSEDVVWELFATQQGKQVWKRSGEGTRVLDEFSAATPEPVTLRLHAQRNSISKEISTTIRPRKSLPAFDWWVADSFTRVFQDDLPPQRAVRRVDLDAARNDRESFQICLRPTESMSRNVQVHVSDLVLNSTARIPRSAIEWFRVGYVWVEQPFAHPYSPRHEAAWWPDPLLPASAFSVSAGQVQPLWFTISVPKNASSGTYTGEITISSDGTAPVKAPISVTVHSAIVPDQGYMKTAFALMDCYMERVYGRFDKRLRRAYTDYLLAHHINPDDISRTKLPDLAELEYADKHGLNAFNILNVVPEAKPGQLWVCFSDVAEYTPEFKKRFFERLDAFVPELEKHGLIDKAYIYGFDERGPEYIPIIRELFGEIKRRYPRVHTLSTCWPPEGTDPLSLNIDWYVPLSSSYKPALAEKVRRSGGEMWWYVCMGPNYPYANWLLENPLVESRLVFWQAFANDVEGFLYWGLNIWERKNNSVPIKLGCDPRLDWSVTTGGNHMWLNGDGDLIYPGEKGPIGSVRMENIRDGLEDTELLRLYRERKGDRAAKGVVREISADCTHYSRNPSSLLGGRLKVLKALE